MSDDITIGVTEIVNNIEVTAQPNDQIVDISVIDNADDVTLNITPTVIEINVNRGSSFAKWGTILGTLSDQTDLQDALDLKADLVDGKVPSSQLPSYVDDVIEVANYAALPATGETGKIYVTIDNNKIFRWTGSTYVEIIDSAAVWGAITGTLSSQTDLQNALNLKANDNAVVKLTGDQSITGSKSFTTNTAAPAMVVTNNSTDNGILLQNTSTGRGITSNNVSTGIGIRSDNTGGGTGISSSNTGAGTGIVSTNTSTTGSALSISNSSTGYGILLTNSTGTGISSSNTGSGTGFYSNNSSTGNGIQSINSSSGYGISSSNTGSGRGIYSSNNSTGDAINIANSGSGRGIYLTNASSGNSLILNNGTSATGIPFTVSKNGTDKFTINDAGEATGVKFIKSGGTSSQFLKADGSVDSSTYALTSQLHDAVTLGTTGVLNGLSLSGQVLSLATASSTTRGALTAEDYSYFFGKQNALTNPVTGTGTTNYLPKFTGSSAIGNSLIYDNGTNVGIGTPSPSAKLDVVGGGIRFGNGTIIGELGYSSRAEIGTISNHNLGFTTNSITQMLITSGGLVGIGTTSPTEKLDISGNLRLSDTAPYLTLKPSGWSGSAYIQAGINLAQSAAGDYFSFQNLAGKGFAFQRGTTTDMLINSSGNIGIGTTSPISALQVGAGTVSSIPSYVKILSTGSSDTGIASAINNKAIYLYNNGSTLKLDAYDYSASAALDVQIGGNGGKILLSGGNVGIGTTSPSRKLYVNGQIGLNDDLISENGANVLRLGYQSYYGSGGFNLTTEGSVPLTFGTASIEKMRITSGGNVGIGTTSPSGKLEVSGSYAQFNGGGIDATLGEAILFGNTTYPTAQKNRIRSSISATGANNLLVFETGTATAGTYNNNQLVLRGDGNVGIGTTSPSAKLHVIGASESLRLGTTTSDNYFTFFNSTGTQLGDIGYDGRDTNILSIWNNSNGGVLFGANGAERMRITSGGNVLIKTSSEFAGNYTLQVATGSAGGVLIRDVSGNGVLQKFQHTTGTEVGSITQNSAATSYNTTSDYRLKQDLKPINGLDLVSQIKVYDYEWKSNKTRAYGVLAHELQEIIPQAVNGEKDAEEMQGVDYSKLVPILVQAIQELQEKINKLENK